MSTTTLLLGHDSSCPLNRTILITLWAGQFFDVVVYDIIYALMIVWFREFWWFVLSLLLITPISSFIPPRSAWKYSHTDGMKLERLYTPLLLGSLWCTYEIINEARLFRRDELTTTSYYRAQVRKEGYVLAQFLFDISVMLVRKGGSWDTKGVGMACLMVAPFWLAFGYAVKVRKEEGVFREGFVKGLW